MLTGRYRKDVADAEGRLTDPGEANLRKTYFNDRNYAILDALAGMAESRGCSIAELAIAWLLSRQEVASVIAGVTKMDQLEINAKASSLALSLEELAALERLSSL